jgi:N-acetylglucosamine-6-sulfatase
MVVGTRAPHGPHRPSDNHRNDFNGVDLPRFGEGDVSDKPAAVRNAPPLDERRTDRLREEYEGKLETLQDVDDLVGKLLNRLEATGQLEDTYVIFASDNGYFLGQHRLTKKSLPYEEAIRIPFVVRGPGVPARKLDHLVINSDFAPTVADLAGIEPPASWTAGPPRRCCARRDRPRRRGEPASWSSTPAPATRPSAPTTVPT